MTGRHRSDGNARRAGLFVGITFAGTLALLATLTASGVTGRPTATGEPTNPETAVSMRTYPVPRPTADRSGWTRHLRAVDTRRPTRAERPPATRPAQRRPGRTRPARRPGRICYVFRFPGDTVRYCVG